MDRCEAAPLERPEAMSIAHIIGGADAGGAERMVVNLLNELAPMEPVLILTGRRGTGALLENLDRRVTVLHVHCRLRRMPQDVMRLAGVLRERRIQVVHSHMFGASLFAALAARTARVPVFLTSEHGLNPWKRVWHRWIERHLISRYARARICVSQDIRKVRASADGIPDSQLRLIPNGTCVGEAGEERMHPVPRLLAVGRLIEAKDYPTLISAARLLREAGVEFELNVAGDGPLRASLEQSSRMAGVDGCVHWLGSRRDVEALMRSSDVFVMSSMREGQPMVLLEAMAAARPIVATAVGGIPGTVAGDREALLVPPRDPKALAAAVRRLIEDPELARTLGANARRRAVQEFSIEAIARAHLNLYQSLLAGAKA